MYINMMGKVGSGLRERQGSCGEDTVGTQNFAEPTKQHPKLLGGICSGYIYNWMVVMSSCGNGDCNVDW